MLSATNAQHQGDAHPNHSEISPNTCQWLSSKIQNITGVGEDVQRREPLYTIGRNVKWYSQYGKQYGTSSSNYN